MFRFKPINVNGDLFATAVTFSAQAGIKLVSSVILTRILAPSAYGVIAIVMSIVYILVMLSDVGFTTCIVRSARGDDVTYLQTAWTIRFVRAVFDTIIMYIASPAIAALYHAPSLTLPLRVVSVWFLIDALESASFPVSIRRKNARVFMYSELLGSFISTIFTLIYCYITKTFWGMVYGILLSRLITVLMSYRYYPELRPRFCWERAAAKEIWEYTRYVIPSSFLSIVLNQFDRAIFLRFFDLRLLGIYSLAGNISSPVSSFIGKTTQMVLYPRCAHTFRADRGNLGSKYYLENIRLFAGILAIPAALAGASHLLITVLYDPRYRAATEVLEAFMARAVLLALSSPAENLLVATGESRLILMGNVYRVIWMVGASLLGYHFFGFLGFTYGIALSALPALAYYLWLQHRKGLLVVKYELYKLGFTAGVALSAYLASNVILMLWPSIRLKL